MCALMMPRICRRSSCFCPLSLSIMMSITSSSSSSQPKAGTSAEVYPQSPNKTKPESRVIPQGKAVDRALAITLDKDCMHQWGEVIYDQLYPGTRTTDSPEISREKWARLALSIAEYMAYETYCKFPSIPVFRRGVLLITYPRLTWLLVLRDNSSHEALHAPLVPEDVNAAIEFLGVKQKGLKWYDVSSRVNGASRVISANY